MSFWKIITLACSAIIVDAKWHHHLKRDIPIDICDTVFNTTNKVQCYCVSDRKEPPAVLSAECYLTKSISSDDSAWTKLKSIKTIHRLTLINTRGVPLTYVPTEALKETTALSKLDIKYGQITTIGSFAFANLSSVEEIMLRDNQIIVLEPYAFIHHNKLKAISLDGNKITEINRNVFVDLPVLEKLYLTDNQISTIHDRAFINLTNLKELEIDRNKVFSLNFAVFEGLKKLEKLELSGNSLEVIGDSTFQALENLKTLNLEGNKIQMLDQKPFNGLGNLMSLSLARNQLSDVDNQNVFDGLSSLVSLSLKGNQLKQLKSDVIAPILTNFYGDSGNLDVEDNNFTCGCDLEWFMSLMNKTLNRHLRITTENLKCVADALTKELYVKAQEMEKNTPSALEEEDVKVQGAEYEYYDEAPFDNGKLFYIDVRDLMHCNKDSPVETIATTLKPYIITVNTITTTTVKATEASKAFSNIDTTTITNEVIKTDKNIIMEHNNVGEHEAVTTTRLATVSAKPVPTKIYDNMASDEAKPDKSKSHRSVPEQITNSETGSRIKIKEEKVEANNANKNLGCVMLIVITVLSFRLST